MFLKERRNRAEDEDVDEGEARKVDEFWSVGVVSVNFSFREKRPTLLTPPTRLFRNIESSFFILSSWCCCG